MHVCCVYVKQITNDDDYPGKINNALFVPIGISYISGSLQKEGFTTEMIYCTPFTFDNGIANYIEKEPQVIAVSIMSGFDVELSAKLISYLRKQYCKAKIIVGGVYVTLEPNTILNKIKEVDAVCIGAGEKAVVEYVKQVKEGKYYKTNNLWIKTSDNNIIKCDKVLAIENLDELAYPDRKCWEKWLYDPITHQIVSLSRGCIYNCLFCANKDLKKKIDNPYFRERTVQSVIDEIDYVVKNYKNIKNIFFVSENALANIDNFKSLCIALKKYNDKLEHKLSFITSINFTPNLLKDFYLLNLIKEANFVKLQFSLESGSIDIRKKLRKPLYNNDQLVCFCNLLHERKIKCLIHVMYCFPYETKKTYWETIDCLRRCKPATYTYTWLLMEETKNYKAKLIDRIRYLLCRWLVYSTYKDLSEAIYLSISPYRIFSKVITFWDKVAVYMEKQYNKRQKKAKQEMDKGHYKQAIKYFNKIKIREDNYWIYGDRAMAKLNIGDYKGAIKDFDEILNLDPKEIFKQKRQECLNLLSKKAS